LVGDELAKLLFQQFILGLGARDEAEDLLQNLAQGVATINVPKGVGFRAPVQQEVVFHGFGRRLVQAFEMAPLPAKAPLAAIQVGCMRPQAPALGHVQIDAIDVPHSGMSVHYGYAIGFFGFHASGNAAVSYNLSRLGSRRGGIGADG
jgi:hypothetical protein